MANDIDYVKKIYNRLQNPVFAKPLNFAVKRILLSGLSGDEKLATVSRYARLMVEQGKRDPRVRDLAVRVSRQCAGKDYLCEAKALHAYVRDNVRYIKDTVNVERFATPERTLFTEKAGDCDDSSIALSALLESIGHETRMVLVDGDLSGRFSHVIAQVKIGDKWYWMETTKPMPFGWKPPFTISHIIDKNSIGEGEKDMEEDLFGNVGLGEALGEIGALDSYIGSAFGSLEQETLGEFGDIEGVIEDAKQALSRALNINAKVAAVEAQFRRLTQKIAGMRNKKAAAALSQKMRGLQSYISKAKSLNSTVQGAIAALKTIIGKAAQAIANAKKKALETAKAAKEKAAVAARALKEKAQKAAQFLAQKKRQAAGAAKAAGQKVNAALKQQAQKARAVAQQSVQQARAVAQRSVQQARAVAQQAAQKAKAVAQQSAQQVRAVAQRAAQAVRSYVPRISAPVRNFVSSFRRRGLRGLGDLGIAPVAIIGIIATISGILAYIASQMTSIDFQANAAEAAGGGSAPSDSDFQQQEYPEKVQAAVDRAQDKISEDYQNGDITKEEAQDKLDTVKERAQDLTEKMQPAYTLQYVRPGHINRYNSNLQEWRYSATGRGPGGTNPEGLTKFFPRGTSEETVVAWLAANELRAPVVYKGKTYSPGGGAAPAAQFPEKVQAAVDRAQDKISEDYQNGDITKEEARDKLVMVKKRAQDITEQMQPEPEADDIETETPDEETGIETEEVDTGTPDEETGIETEEVDTGTDEGGNLLGLLAGGFDDLGDLGAAKKKKKKTIETAAQKKERQSRRTTYLAARAKPKGTVWDRIVDSGKTLGIIGVVAWAGVNLLGKVLERRKING